MSIELKDLRTKITEETDVWLEVISNQTGKDRAEIARLTLHEAALKEISMASLICQKMKEKGLSR